MYINIYIYIHIYIYMYMNAYKYVNTSICTFAQFRNVSHAITQTT